MSRMPGSASSDPTPHQGAAAGLSRFGRVLSLPHTASLVVASIVARLPLGLEGLALILVVRDRTHSFALAGLASGALGVAAAIAAPLLGRLIDRRGAPGVLILSAGAHTLGLVALLVVVTTPLERAALIPLSAWVGASTPPVTATLRVLWPRLLTGRDDLLSTAYAIESIIFDTVLVAGPLVTAVLASLGRPGDALWLAAVISLAGTTWIALSPLIRKPAPYASPADAVRVRISAGLRTIIGASFPIGFCFGMLEIALVACGSSLGSSGDGGVLLALWSAGSLVGGLLYGSRSFARPARTRYLTLLASLPCSAGLLAAGTTLTTMIVLTTITGAVIGPLITAEAEVVSGLVGDAQATEIFSWTTMVAVFGVSSGTAVAGALVSSLGWQGLVVSAKVVALGCVGVVACRAGTLKLDASPESGYQST